MNALPRFLVLAAACGIVWATASLASAYDSVCYLDNGDSCEEGPQAARERWAGPSDEHRRLFEQSMTYAGLPEPTKTPLQLRVYTNGDTVEIAGEAAPTLMPAAFDDVTNVRERTKGIDEFSQLPDFGYSLFDWALGLETCPVDDVDAKACHTFGGHMGTLNSNHFMPQAQHFYRHYHQLALDRAAECKAMRGGLGNDAMRFVSFLRDCEKEALLLEATAHHFLQDAWSSGHMWERWGSPEVQDFPSPFRGLAVAATSGIIHGARALLQPSGVPEWIIDVPDAMCARHPEVEWVAANGTPHRAVGDLYLSDMLEQSTYDAQRGRLFSCAAAGIRQVYQASGQAHGDLAAPSGPVDSDLDDLDPASDECFGQRVTNRALHKGFGIDVVLLSGQAQHLAFTPALVVSFAVASLGVVQEGVAEAVAAGAQYALDMVAVAAKLEYNSVLHPNDTNMASGGLPALLEIKPNGQYVYDPPAHYVDPQLPWKLAAEANQTDPETALLRTFHRAHAADWCAAFADGTVTLQQLQQRVDTIKGQLTSLPPGDPSAQGLDSALGNVCDLCAEFTARHLRVGVDVANYDVAREPLCALLNPAAPLVYEPGAGEPTRELALRWCHCAGAVCEGSFEQAQRLYASPLSSPPPSV